MSRCAVIADPLGTRTITRTELTDGRGIKQQSAEGRVRRYSIRTDGVGIVVPSQDGLALYRFSSGGRHLATVDTQLGIEVLSFGYRPDGRLQSVRVSTNIEK